MYLARALRFFLLLAYMRGRCREEYRGRGSSLAVVGSCAGLGLRIDVFGRGLDIRYGVI
jgi:hypothetical protein